MAHKRKRFDKTAISVRVNALLLRRLDEAGEVLMRNRSEMVEKCIEAWLDSHFPLPPSPPPPARGKGR